MSSEGINSHLPLLPPLPHPDPPGSPQNFPFPHMFSHFTPISPHPPCPPLFTGDFPVPPSWPCSQGIFLLPLRGYEHSRGTCKRMSSLGALWHGGQEVRTEWRFRGSAPNLLAGQDNHRMCWLGLEPQGTPSHTLLPPNGSPSHHLGHRDRDPAQNSDPDLAVGVPVPESQLFAHHFGPPKPGSIF